MHEMGCEKNNSQINEDLSKERLKCTFNTDEVTYILDGGKEKTLQRRKVENIVFRDGASKDVIPDECLDLQQRYENAVRKSTVYANLLKNELLEYNELHNYGTPILRRTADAFFKETSPFMLHMGMFVPTLIGQATPEQQAKWLPKALSMEIVGAYAQTELGHGTFVRGLETTATYDPKTDEFVLNSPTLTSYKWWCSGIGKTANHSIVFAQLYSEGKCHGIFPFIVQIRDMETHMPLPGIKVGDVGVRMGYNTADNGYLILDNFRIPRENMLMKNAQVTKEGKFIKKARHGKLTYGTMVFVRVTLVKDAAYNLAKASTIAIRYSAVRRQCEHKPNFPELQILDYPTQQHKLFICVATAHALQLTGDWLWRTFTSVQSDMQEGNLDKLPELHALSSCLKAMSTSVASTLIAQCRHACGGHGYMMSSCLPQIYSNVVATRIYEGDYTVLMLQTARFLVKAWEQAERGEVVTPTVSYLNQSFKKQPVVWDNSPEVIINAFKAVAAGKISQSVKNIRDHVKSGVCFDDAWQLATVRLVAAAEAHCLAVMMDSYWNEMLRLTVSSSDNVKTVLRQLTSLFLIYWTMEKSGDLLRFSLISGKDFDLLQIKYEELLTAIRPNAVGIVDAFDIRDEILQSSLGSYDGRVYERLMEEALKSPLNKEVVDQSFHKYMKPLRQQSQL